jgi:hypothetical protein
MSGRLLRNGRNSGQRISLASPTKDDKEDVHSEPDETETFPPEDLPKKKKKMCTTKAEAHSIQKKAIRRSGGVAQKQDVAIAQNPAAHLAIYHYPRLKIDIQTCCSGSLNFSLSSLRLAIDIRGNDISNHVFLTIGIEML